jgi:hypothetical protein
MPTTDNKYAGGDQGLICIRGISRHTPWSFPSNTLSETGHQTARLPGYPGPFSEALPFDPFGKAWIYVKLVTGPELLSQEKGEKDA